MISDLLEGRKTMIVVTTKSVQELSSEVDAEYSDCDLKPEIGIWPKEPRNTDFVPRVYFSEYIEGEVLKNRQYSRDKLALVINPCDILSIPQGERGYICLY